MNVGGQAVMEGVMMRNKDRFAIAVRLPSGKIKLKKEKSSFPSFFNVFFVRGVVGLGYMLRDGMKALSWSSQQQLGEEEKLSASQLVMTILISLMVAVLLFVVIPFFLAHAIKTEGIWFNILDGFFRLLVVAGYLAVIAQMKDVQRLFQYHGAEHKSIYCYEAGQRLTVPNVKRFSRFHPRCGTSFIFIVLLISIFVFSFVTGVWWVKLVGRIVLMPAIGGISYELLKLGGRYQQNILVRILIAPGLWLQRITTREPSARQIEVSICALKAVVE